MTKDDFLDWKSHPVTKAVFAALTARITNVQEELGFVAGENPTQDRYRTGAIQGYRDVLGTTWGDISGEAEYD